MTTCRHFQTCALVEDTNEIVILAGTTRPTSSSCKNVYRNSVEILDLGTKTFRSGKITILGRSIQIKDNNIIHNLLQAPTFHGPGKLVPFCPTRTHSSLWEASSATLPTAMIAVAENALDLISFTSQLLVTADFSHISFEA